MSAEIIGAHVLLYSDNPESDRTFFRDILSFPAVDAGGGWLIFALPPPKSGFIHPTAKNVSSTAEGDYWDRFST